MDFSIPFRHVHADEMDSSSMAAVSDDLFCPVHDGSVVDSRGVKPSLGQYTDEMVLSFFSSFLSALTFSRKICMLSAGLSCVSAEVGNAITAAIHTVTTMKSPHIPLLVLAFILASL
jgi:hypothetical protein